MDARIQEILRHVRELEEKEDYEEIFRLLHSLDDEHPESHIGPHWLAHYLMIKGHLDEALSYADIAVKRAPFVSGPTYTYAAILIELGRHKDARIQLEILRSLDQTNSYKDQATALLEKIYFHALDMVLPVPQSGISPEDLSEAISVIMGDTCSLPDRIDDSISTERYRVRGVEKRYVVWITSGYTLSIQIDCPEDLLHNHVIFEGTLTAGMLILSPLMTSGTQSHKEDMDLKTFFESIINVCDVFRKDPKRLFYVEHGLDSGEWGPEEDFSPNDYKRILDLANEAVYGYQINFDLETWWGWVKGRSNIGYGTWLEGEGSSEMISRLKMAIAKARR